MDEGVQHRCSYEHFAMDFNTFFLPNPLAEIRLRTFSIPEMKRLWRDYSEKISSEKCFKMG